MRTQTLCILQAILCLPELVVTCKSGNQRSHAEETPVLPSLLPGRFMENGLQHGRSLEDPNTSEALSSAALDRGLALSHSCAHTSGSGMCHVLMTCFCCDCCQSHGFLLYVLKANNP